MGDRPNAIGGLTMGADPASVGDGGREPDRAETIAWIPGPQGTQKARPRQTN